GRVADMKSEMERAEQLQRRETQFNNFYEAARVALQHNNAAEAIENLTKALTVDPENSRAQELLKSARAAFEKNRLKAEFSNVFGEAEYHYNNRAYSVALASVEKALEIDQDPRAIDLKQKIEESLREKT